MSETLPTTKEAAQPIDRRWGDAIHRVDAVAKRNYPQFNEQQLHEAAEEAKRKLVTLSQQEKLKFVETQLEDGTNLKHIEPIYAETFSEGLPVGDVVEYLGYGDSHEFTSGQPASEWYLPSLANVLNKPVVAYVEGLPVTEVQPQPQLEQTA